MKLLREPIQIAVWYDFDGTPHPVRFRYEDDNKQLVTVIVQKSIRKEMNKFAGNKMVPFECQSVINNEIRRFELRYELETCRWFIYKI